MAVRIELRRLGGPACEACGATEVVASGIRPEYEPQPVDGDADLAAEMAGMEAEIRELVGPIAPPSWWAARGGRAARFAVRLDEIVTGMKQQTVRGS